MATTATQDSEFLAAVVSSLLLEDAIDWIKSNMNPDDVFNEKDLVTWAEENGYEAAGRGEKTMSTETTTPTAPCACDCYAELRLRRLQMSRFPFCPDHRDKVYGKECRECEIERLHAIIEQAYRKLSSVAIERSIDAVPEIVQVCDRQASEILSRGLRSA